MTLNGSGQVHVEINIVKPGESKPEFIQYALQAVARGAERVLIPRVQGADIQVQRLVLHPTDFNFQRCARLTAAEIERLLRD